MSILCINYNNSKCQCHENMFKKMKYRLVVKFDKKNIFLIFFFVLYTIFNNICNRFLFLHF